MKSFKNHLSLITALFTILFTIQIFIIVERAIASYEQNLSQQYSIIVIANSTLQNSRFIEAHPFIERSETITVDDVLERLTRDMKQKNVDLLKLSLPKFYRIYLKSYPSPRDIDSVGNALKKIPSVSKIESFAQSHDTLYNLLLLFKNVVSVFALTILAVTTLLIIKEMRLWQFQHSERMNIMALFGAPVWLRSAVLFRLSIVDAIIASGLINAAFSAIEHQRWIHEQLGALSITLTLFDPIRDGLMLFGIAMGISIVLASMIIMGHKEEV
ncbi:MAG: cell division protein FtsX [Campylobacterales bacterium]|nr:cell division protein FtsX [Campylobacterales bacterium]